MKLGKDLEKFRLKSKKERISEILKELEEINIIIRKCKVILNKEYPNEFGYSKDYLNEEGKKFGYWKDTLLSSIGKKVWLEKAVGKNAKNEINSRFVAKSVSKDVQRYFAEKVGKEDFFEKLSFIDQFNGSKKSFTKFLLTTLKFSIPVAIFFVKESFPLFQISESEYKSINKKISKYNNNINSEADWKRDLLMKKILEYFVKKLNTERFKNKFKKLGEDFPKEKLQEANLKMNEYRQKIKLNRKKLLQKLGIEEDFKAEPSVNTENDFILFIGKKLGLVGENVETLSFLLAEDRERIVEQILHDIRKKGETERLATSEYVNNQEILAGDFHDNFMPYDRIITDYEAGKRKIFKEIFDSLDINSLGDALLEIFGKAKGYKEFRRLYKKYREMGLDEILEEHNRSKERKSLEKLAKLGQDVPEETFPGEVLYKDSEGNEYNIFTLKTPRQLEYEGHLPNGQERHCIGRDGQSYKKQVKNGSGLAFSVRKNGVAGEICWTMWYDKQSKTIKQIKGPGNIRMSNLKDPSIIAVLNAIGKIKEKEIVQIERIEDLNQLNLSTGTFLVYNGKEISEKSFGDLKKLNKDEKVIYGTIEIDLKTVDYELLEQVFQSRAKIDIKVTRTNFFQQIHTGHNDINQNPPVKEAQISDPKLIERYMELIIKYGRGDVANDLLEKFWLDFHYFENENFWKILKMSDGHWIMNLLEFSKKGTFFKYIENKEQRYGIEVYDKNFELLRKIIEIAQEKNMTSGINLLSIIGQIFDFFGRYSYFDFDISHLIKKTFDLFLFIVEKNLENKNLHERHNFFSTNSPLYFFVKKFRIYAQKHGINMSSFNQDLDKNLRKYIKNLDLVGKSIMFTDFKLRKLI